MSYESNSFVNNLDVEARADAPTWGEVIAAFVSRKESTCPWYGPEGGLKSKMDQLVRFGYGYTGPVVAYWEGETLRVVRGRFMEDPSGSAEKARNMLIKAAKVSGITPLWGKYDFEMRGEKPVEVSLKTDTQRYPVLVERPVGITIDGRTYRFDKNIGLINGSGFSGLERPDEGGKITFVWSDETYVIDDRNKVYRLAGLTAWEGKVGHRVKENGEYIFWFE
jgi:hypothetical protein